MEKKNTGLVVTLLILLVLGLGSYIVADKVLSAKQGNKIEESVETNNNQLEEKDYDLGEAKVLISKYIVVDPYLLFGTDFNNQTKNILALLNVPTIKTRLEICDNLYQNSHEKDVEGYIFDGGREVCPFGKSVKAISYEEANNVYSQLFDGNMSKEYSKLLGFVYDYVDEKNVFVSLDTRYGGVVPESTYEVISAKITNGELKINVEAVSADAKRSLTFNFKQKNGNYVLVDVEQ